MDNNFFQNIIEKLEENAAKIYLIVANLILVTFAIWFSNLGLLPFSNVGDFAFFFILSFLLGIYRPSWMFVFFIGTLVLENINLAPNSIGLSLRPYQLFGFIAVFSILIQLLSNRLNFSLPKWKWYDAMPLVFALGGIFSSFAAVNHGSAFKQAIIAISFVSFYYLTRVYIQSFDDLKRIMPFFISSGLVVSIYGILQNVRFLSGTASFEVMPGRPNGTFTEPDWFGVYLVLLISVLFSVIYRLGREMEKNKLLLAVCYSSLVFIFIVLILTVSRSAWLGAILVTIGFLKVILTEGSLKISKWNWRGFLKHTSAILVIGVISVLISTQLTNFQIFNRAKSTGGLQKITVACQNNTTLNSESVIESINELGSYGCKFINLEDIEKEESAGLNVFEIKRPDPTVGIRAQIYAKSIEQIKKHAIFGIGWGSITDILGKDENGAGLNASNIFLEIWLGSGILGIVSFAILVGWILFKSATVYLNKKIEDKTAVTFVALGLFAILVPNLFNSGIFLGFVWVYIAAAMSLLTEKNAKS